MGRDLIKISGLITALLLPHCPLLTLTVRTGLRGFQRKKKEISSFEESDVATDHLCSDLVGQSFEKTPLLNLEFSFVHRPPLLSRRYTQDKINEVDEVQTLDILPFITG